MAKQKISTIFINGSDLDLGVSQYKLYDAEGTKGHLLIGDGKNPITMTDLEKVKERFEITPGTQIHIGGHGLIEEGTHTLQIFDKVIPTSEALKKIMTGLGCADTPQEVHLWSCYGGAAAKEANVLGQGSCLIAHAPNNDVIFADYAANSIVNLAYNRNGFPLDYLDYRRVERELTVGSAQGSFAGLSNGHGSDSIPVTRFNLENKILTQDDSIRRATQDYADRLHENLSKLKPTKGVLISSEKQRIEMPDWLVERYKSSNFSYNMFNNKKELKKLFKTPEGKEYIQYQLAKLDIQSNILTRVGIKR